MTSAMWDTLIVLLVAKRKRCMTYEWTKLRERVFYELHEIHQSLEESHRIDITNFSLHSPYLENYRLTEFRHYTSIAITNAISRFSSLFINPP
jgi:hypothetical protein